MEDKKRLFGQFLLLLAIMCGLISFWFTLQFTWTPEFAAVNLPEGPTHSNYHAFREALLALAVNLLLIKVMISAKTISRDIWLVSFFMASFYYAGWWLAWPIWGFHTPNLLAELNHAIATFCGILGLIQLKQDK